MRVLERVVWEVVVQVMVRLEIDRIHHKTYSPGDLYGYIGGILVLASMIGRIVGRS